MKINNHQNNKKHERDYLKKREKLSRLIYSHNNQLALHFDGAFILSLSQPSPYGFTFNEAATSPN